MSLSRIRITFLKEADESGRNAVIKYLSKRFHTKDIAVNEDSFIVNGIEYEVVNKEFYASLIKEYKNFKIGPVQIAATKVGKEIAYHFGSFAKVAGPKQKQVRKLI